MKRLRTPQTFEPFRRKVVGGLTVPLLFLLLAPTPSVGRPEGVPRESFAAATYGSPVILPQLTASSAGVWLDPEGKPLPFTSDEEVMEFLRTARVIRSEQIPLGITRPLKVVLEKDGVRMHAIFRDVDDDNAIAPLASGAVVRDFRDSYIFELAAYELSRLLGLDNVPPVILREIRGKSGSLQAWVEDAMNETRKIRDNVTPPDQVLWSRQIHIMRVFDNLIYNTDRNRGNILIDRNWKVWLIDHTRAFRREKELRNPEMVIQYDRKLWEKLKALDKKAVRKRLKKLLRPPEIKGLLWRRDKLVQHIQKLIKERGENKVLFTLD